MSAPSLDGRRLHVVRTAEVGVVNADTIFHFSQEGACVSATYAGGGVLRGYLVGLRSGDRLEFRYAQLQEGDVLNGGHSRCELEVAGDGRVRILEHFQWESRPGGGTNVFEEL